MKSELIFSINSYMVMYDITRKPLVRMNQNPHPVASPQTIIGSLLLPDNMRIEMRAGWRGDLASISFFRENGERIGFVELNSRYSLLHSLHIDPPSRGQGFMKVMLAGAKFCVDHGSLTYSKAKPFVVMTSHRQTIEVLERLGFSRANRIALTNQYYTLKDPQVFHERIRSIGLTVSIIL